MSPELLELQEANDNITRGNILSTLTKEQLYAVRDHVLNHPHRIENYCYTGTLFIGRHYDSLIADLNDFIGENQNVPYLTGSFTKFITGGSGNSTYEFLSDDGKIFSININSSTVWRNFQDESILNKKVKLYLWLEGLGTDAIKIEQVD